MFCISDALASPLLLNFFNSCSASAKSSLASFFILNALLMLSTIKSAPRATPFTTASKFSNKTFSIPLLLSIIVCKTLSQFNSTPLLLSRAFLLL
jgi:hypothetical protein